MAGVQNTILNLEDEVNKIASRLPSQEYTLCKGLKQPFNNTNSGSRKIMQATQTEQATQLLNPEVPIITTGYENQFAQFNSNFIQAKDNYTVIDKIPKFEKYPDIHYWLILENKSTGELTCIERISYTHITEFYGYLFNNDYLDSLVPGSEIHKGDVVKNTISSDEYNNRAEGLNLTTMYIACEDVKEDPIVISESASKRFSTPMIDKIEVRINDNDILLNLYGDDHQTRVTADDLTKAYKTFPDIGEDVKGSILCAVRRELKDEEALFSQSWSRLKTQSMSDKPYIAEGKVIDIDVYCNNPDKLNSVMYNNQIKKYYDQTIVFAKKFISAVDNYRNIRTDVKMSYDLDKMYARCKDVVQGVQYMQDRVFNNIVMNIYVQRNRTLKRGDKITDRYGGKGVVSRVRPDNAMPHFLKNGKWVPVDVLYSKFTCINRLNDGQLFEVSITYQGWQLLEAIREKINSGEIDYNTAFDWICKYVEAYNPQQAEEERHLFDNTNPIDRDTNLQMYVEQIIHEGCIMLSLEPLSSNITIDKVAAVYNMFPFIKKHCQICVPQQDSNGNYRMVVASHPCVIGYKYIFRLKQFAIEKFSVVSLASTNIRNENSKSRMFKTHNAKFASTPVRIFGEMESSTIGAHIGTEIFYEEFMLASSSPEGRRSHEKLLTGDPFEFNITLDKDCTSLTADIGQAYLKTLGERLRFIKLKKFIRHPIIKEVMSLAPMRKKNVMYFIDKNASDEEVEKKVRNLRAEDEENDRKPRKDVMEIIPGVMEERLREEEYEAKLKKLGLKKPR